MNRHRVPTLALTVLGALLVPVAGSSAGDPAKGAELATGCLGCHGIAGYRNAYPSYRVPKLGGQRPEYLVLAMQAYRAKARTHATMQAQTASLSDEDMQDIAAFFASQGEARTGSAKSGLTALPRGAAAVRGREKADVCAACHGEAGASPGPVWPTLAGQHRDYIEHAMAGYRSKLRKDPVMQAQAMPLSDRDIKDIAAFYSAQAGLFTVRQ